MGTDHERENETRVPSERKAGDGRTGVKSGGKKEAKR